VGILGRVTRRARRPAGVLSLAAASLLPACGPPPDPADLPVALLDSRPVTRRAFDAYLRENLPTDEAREAPAAAETDEVKSRLFDNFLDEEVLLAEANRRRIEVSDSEIEAYLGEDARGDSAGEPAQKAAASRGEEEKRRARRDLAIQKLRDALGGGGVVPAPDEVAAYLEKNRDALRTKPTVIFRGFRVTPPADAATTAREIAKMKPKLARATRTGEEPGPEYGLLQEASTEDLADDLRAAIEKLAPGDVSAPVKLEGETWIFYLVGRPAPAVDDERTLTERARRALLRSRVEEESARALAELKRKTTIEVRAENLGFRYVPERAR
jgi:parvulin-like peptidyl-prolyl isomerase